MQALKPDVTVLVIDDDPNNIEILQLDLEDSGYSVLTASGGAEGWEILQRRKKDIKVILLDRMMDGVDGMAFMKKLKADANAFYIPVIMQTAAAEHDKVVEGVAAGVYYYLTKPYEKEIMLSIIQAAINDYKNISILRQDIEQFKSKLRIVNESFFEVRTLEDVRYLTTFLVNFFPDPGRVLLGVSELMLNAVEHGNLGITYEQKTQLVKENNWEVEVMRLLVLPEHVNKQVTVHFKRESDHIMLRIKDEGQGFSWQDYLEINPDRATHSHGRGIALSKLISFDEMEYKGCGNEVVCKVYTHEKEAIGGEK